ncbi:hypothetical protein [Microbacterium lacticum]
MSCRRVGFDRRTYQATREVVKLVNEELARLDREATRAERAAERWEQIAARVDTQRAAHRAEDDESATALHKAEDETARVRAEIAEPLTTQATRDGGSYLAAVEGEAAARARLSTVGRFGRRKARAEQRAATENAQTLREQVSAEWGTTPTDLDRLPEWAARVAAKRAETDPRVTNAAQVIEAAAADREATLGRHKQERLALLASEYGAERVRRDHLGTRMVNPRRDARDARTRAATSRAEADELRGLPITDAARRIEVRRVEQEQARQRAAQRARQLHDPFERGLHRSGTRREGPTRSI